MTNEDRAERARKLIESSTTNSLDEDVIDALTDLQHLCDREALDFNYLYRVAQEHYTAEVIEEDPKTGPTPLFRYED